MLDHQDRRRGALRQARAPAQQQIFQTALQGGIQSGTDQRRAVRRVQPPRQQRRQARLAARRQQHRLLQRLAQLRRGPHLELRQTPQHLVACRLSGVRVTVRAQPAGCLGQHRKQRRLGMGQLARRLAQIRPTGRCHPLQSATEGRAIEVQGENFRLRQVPLQLQGAPQLLELAGQAARVRVEQPRHLHRQGAATGHHPPTAEVLPGRPPQGKRVDPRVLIKPAVFITEQRLQIRRRHLFGRDRVTPHPLRIGKAPQRRAVLGQHHPRLIVLWQRQWEQAVGGPEQNEQAQRRNGQDSPQAARLARQSLHG